MEILQHLRISLASACWGAVGASSVFLLGARSDASVYMHQEHNYLAYVRLNDLAGHRHGSNVRGELETATADDQAESGIKVGRADFSGSRTGSGLLIETDGLLGLGSRQLYGTLAGGRLVLNVPTDAGSIEKAVFVLASEAQWNRALAEFQVRRTREVAKLRRRQARAAAIQELERRFGATQEDQYRSEQRLAELTKQNSEDEHAQDQAQEQLEAASRRLGRVKGLYRIAKERQKDASAVAKRARELADQCGSAGSLEAVQHAQQAIEAAKSQVREVKDAIHDVASRISRGEAPADADLDKAEQRLDEASGQLGREMAALSAPHGRPDDDTRSAIESAAGDVESAAGDVESAVGDAESAVGDVESAVGDVESQASDAQSRLADAKAKTTQDHQAAVEQQAQISADQQQMQGCQRQLTALGLPEVRSVMYGCDPAWDWFAQAIQHYDPNLPRSTALRLAEALIAAGSSYQVDASLLLAVLVADGSLAQLEPKTGTIAGPPAEGTVLAAADDISQRLSHPALAEGQAPTAAQLAQVLAARCVSRSGASGEAAKRYAARVARLYTQICDKYRLDD